MKTTTQDSNHNQEKSTPEVNAKNQQAQIVQPVELDGSAPLELDNSFAGDQLTLPLAVTDTIAMVSDDDKAKKRKQEKEEDEQKAKADKQEIAKDAEAQVDSDGQAEVSAEESVEESLVSGALDSQASSAGDMGGFSDLSATTIFLSAFGIIGAASYYKNVNKDQAPSFTSLSRANDIDENSGAGQVVYTAVADDDSGEDAVITYSLANGSDSALSIDATSGEVTLSANPDYEIQSQYSFAVIATDSAGNASDPKSVILVITDLDEIAPTITSGDTAVSINENSGAGQVVYTAVADDSADVSDGPITFSLGEGSDAELNINAVTGEVTLTANPDFEAKNEYNFAVIATDTAGNESAPQPVSLAINNLDDTAPTITSGDTAVAIDENSGAGQVVY
ncbi:MAG: cadherin repeat domain-containing protein, partial [Porticoccaceae bacterium]